MKNSLVYNFSVWETTLKEAFVQAKKEFKFVMLEWVKVCFFILLLVFFYNNYF